MAFFDEWKEKWESWSLTVKGAVIGGVLLLLVGVGSLFPKKEEAVEELAVVETTMLAEKTEVSTTQEVVIFVDIKGAVKNVKMPYLIKKMLEKAGKLPKD